MSRIKDKIHDFTSGLGDVTEIIDKVTQDAEERDQVISSRHEVDMKSDNYLSKIIRPLTLLILLFLELVVIVLDATGHKVSVDITIQLGALLGAAIGFYFNSKKAERTAERNINANIKIREMMTKHQIRQERKNS